MKLKRIQVEKAIGAEVGPSSTKFMSDRIMRIKNLTLTKIGKVISHEWGPNITKAIMNNFKSYMRTH